MHRYKAILLSAVLNVGYDELEKVLAGKTTVFAGQSGVGKSTILNRIMDSYVMKTGEVSDKIERKTYNKACRVDRTKVRWICG